MSLETKLALDCPYCHEAILESFSWFKKSYSTCPNCERDLVAGQFAALIANLEQAMDANIEEMLYGAPASHCCGHKSNCK